MSEYELHAMEYEHLKDEQVRRIGFRDNLIYVSVTVMAGIFGFAIQDGHSRHLLLVVCPATLVFGWTYLANDQKISAIGDYLRHTLRPRLAAAAGAQHDHALQWETSRYTDSGRNRRKALQLVVDLTTFCLPSVAALTSYALTVDLDAWGGAGVAAESVLTLGLAWEIVRAAELRSGTGPDQG